MVPAPATPTIDRARFDEFFETHLDAVWRMVASLGVPPSDVDDVCQEVFIVVHRKLPSFEGRAAPSTWLYAICWRVWSDHRKRARRRPEAAIETADAPAPDPPADDRVHWARELLELRGLLEGLDDDKRAVFVLYEVEGLQMKEIVEIVGCPLQTGFTRLRAARKAIRMAWDDKSHDG